MKRARIINAIIWIALSVTLCVWVSIEWHNQGCSVSSLITACAMYIAMPGVLGMTIDQTIKEKES